MTRAFTIQFATDYYIRKQVSIEDTTYLLASYCDEFKKDSQKTQVFIALLKQMGIINNCISTALEFYMAKYNVLMLYKENIEGTYLGNLTTKQILLIY